MDFVCNTTGSHKLTLTAVPDSPFGAVYGDVLSGLIEVKTVPQDYDGNTVANQVADTITINCVSGPVPSPTPTALPLPPTPTALPLPPTPPPCPLTPSGSPLPGMSLEAPATVSVGATFTLCVNADPSPPELIAAFTAEVLFGAAPELDECDNTFDDDGDAIVNDGCPQVGGAPEAGRFCDNTTDDEDNDLAAPGIQIDGFINDGCPQVGATAESDQCAGNIDDDGDGFVNDGCPAEGAPETGVQCAAGNDTDDDGFLNLGDGFVNDGCPAVGDPEFDECANAINDDPGDDPFVNDGCPVVQVTEAGACDGRIDDDNDGAPNDGCSQVGVTGEAGSFCDDTVDDDSDGFVNDGCRSAGTPEVGPACANATDDDGDGRPNDGCLMKGADLTWLQRPSCEDEVQVTLKDGGGLAICDSLDTFVLGGAGIGVLGDSGLPPFANLNVTPSSTTLLVELDFVCNTPGSHTLTLTAEPDSPPGALYAGTAANALFLKTVLAQIDLNFDGVPEPHQVADTLVINCVAPVGGLVVDLAPQQDGLPAATGDSRAGNARLLAAVAAGVTAAALALTGAAWYARRRRRAL